MISKDIMQHKYALITNVHTIIIEIDTIHYLIKDIYNTIHSCYHYVLNEPIMHKDPLGEFRIKDCQNCNTKLNANDPNEPPEITIINEVSKWCKETINRITDLNLKNCIKERCEKNGIIECEKQCWYMYPLIGSSPGYSFTIPIRIGNTTYRRNTTTAHICLNSWHASNITNVGDIIIHEWAHTCGWNDGENKGVQNINKVVPEK